MEDLKQKVWFYRAQPKKHNGVDMYFVQFLEIQNNQWIIKGLYWALDKESAKSFIDGLIAFDDICFENVKVKNNDTQNWILREVQRNG